MAPTDPRAGGAAARRRRVRLLPLLLTVLAVGAGAWLMLRRRATVAPVRDQPAWVPPAAAVTAPVPPAPHPPAPVPPSPAPAAPAPVPPAPVPTVPTDADESSGSRELQRVSGIGRRSAEALVAAGIDDLERLAGSDDDTLVAALEAAGLRRSPTLSSWASQARRLTQA